MHVKKVCVNIYTTYLLSIYVSDEGGGRIYPVGETQIKLAVLRH